MINLETRKLNLIQEFLKIDNENIIKALEDFVTRKNLEAYELKLKPMTLEKFHEEIEIALEQVSQDNLISTAELKKKIEKWG